MHFFILKENLDKILSIVGRNISSKPQLPILSNILLKTQDNQLKITTTNLELGIIFTTGAKIEKEGEITVPGKLLAEFVNNLNPGKIEFVLEGTNLLVKTDKTKASFATISALDFPTFPKKFEIRHKFKFEKIKDVVFRTVFAASLDEGRPVLTGVKITIAENKMMFTATDGYRLSMENIVISEKKEDFQVILPARSVAEVVRIAQETKTEEIGFSIIKDKNQAIFNLGKTLIFTRVIEGEFPDIQKIIPVAFKTKAIIDKDQFVKAVKITSLFARSSSNIIKIKIQKNGLQIKAATPQIGENEDFIEAQVEGEETEIAFNFRFLLEMLSNFPEEKVVFETSGALNPGVFKLPSLTSSFIHIIMPVRVQE